MKRAMVLAAAVALVSGCTRTQHAAKPDETKPVTRDEPKHVAAGESKPAPATQPKPVAREDAKPSKPDGTKPVIPPNQGGTPQVYAGLAPDEAAKAMTLPEGFKVKLFAAEPDVTQPVALTIDDRGRLWVAQAHTYPRRDEGDKGKDSIIILEDTNGDGSFDKKTVFAEHLNLVSGLEVGIDGVYVGAAPNLLFIPDKNHDDKPDSPPEILLDGWAFQDTHETLNAFNWGPDGWLYGCHGVFTHSNVGKPGTPDDQRTKINAGIWRYHPTKRIFEVFAEGGSNQWGIDWNDQGQAFMTACVIPHLYHVIQGGHYLRQAGKHFNPYTYKDIAPISDHVHWVGDKGPHAGNGKSDSAGGGHAHCGALIYLGDNLPTDLRNSIFMSNIHGNRINNDMLERDGSGFVGHHGKDLLLANDKWFRGISLKTGPDGAVYLIDWYDKQPCHLNKPEVWDRSNGRLYKVWYHDVKPTSVNLAQMSDDELVKLQLHPNDYYVRHARRILQERGSNPKVHQALAEILTTNPDPSRQLRALWALHATGGLTEPIALAQLNNKDEYVRSWAIQLLCETSNPSDTALSKFASMAASDPSPVVRLYLASAMQRTEVSKRWNVLAALITHGEDESDRNLPQMYWYALEPGVAKDKTKALQVMTSAKIPLIRQFITKRMTAN